jgi:multidrug transporter EmrE-like cation transporter
MKIINIILYLIFSVGGLILVKMEQNQVNLSINQGKLDFSIGIKMIVGLVLYILSFIVRKFDLSYIFPIITGITQVLVILAGIFLFKEHISVHGYIGIFCIICGIILLNIK